MSDAFERGAARAKAEAASKASLETALTELDARHQTEFCEFMDKVDEHLEGSNYVIRRYQNERIWVSTHPERGKGEAIGFIRSRPLSYKSGIDKFVMICNSPMEEFYSEYGGSTVDDSLEALGEFITKNPCRTDDEVEIEAERERQRDEEQLRKNKSDRALQFGCMAVVVLGGLLLASFIL